jgi:transcriptional regulator with XRE-family HTH domain
MSTRNAPLVAAERRARQRLRDAIDECRVARHRRGITQRQIAEALKCSRQLVTALEAGHHKDVGLTALSRYAASVGLELSIKLYPAATVLRDIGQVRLLNRFRTLIGDGWSWRTEVPVTRDAREIRAIDAVIAQGIAHVGIEAVTRLVDSQGQVRPIMLKQQASGLDCMILLLADTRHNRAAVGLAGDLLLTEFPLRARELLADLREGRRPSANGLLLV